MKALLLADEEWCSSGNLAMAEEKLQVPVAFSDVAVHFSEKEWLCLEEWQKELYKKVMKNIHVALISLGYTIANPWILFRIKAEDETYVGDPQNPADRNSPECPSTSSQGVNLPDRSGVRKDEVSSLWSGYAPGTKSEAGSKTLKPPDILLRIKKDQEPQLGNCLGPEGKGEQEIPSAGCQTVKELDSLRVKNDEVPNLWTCPDPGMKNTGSRTLKPPAILLRIKKDKPHLWNCLDPEAKGEKEIPNTDSAIYDHKLSLWIKQEEPSDVGDPKDSEESESIPLPSAAPNAPSLTPGMTAVSLASPMTSAKPAGSKQTPTKRTELKLRDKILVLCEYAQKKISMRRLAVQFGVSKTQIGQIIKRKAELLSAFESNVSGDRIRKRRKTENDKLNNIVWEWFCLMRANNVTLSGRVIREKGLQVARDLGIVDFKASNGWLDCFKRTHNIPQFALSRVEVQHQQVCDWISQLKSIHDAYPM